MFYVKLVNDEAEIRIDITDENVFTVCPNCEAEFSVEIIDLCQSIKDFDLYGSAIYCKECSAKMRQAKMS